MCTKRKTPKKFSHPIVHFLPKLCTKCTFYPILAKICALVYFCQKVCTKVTFHLDIAKICVLSAKTSKFFAPIVHFLPKLCTKCTFYPFLAIRCANVHFVSSSPRLSHQRGGGKTHHFFAIFGGGTINVVWSGVDTTFDDFRAKSCGVCGVMWCLHHFFAHFYQCSKVV